MDKRSELIFRKWQSKARLSRIEEDGSPTSSERALVRSEPVCLEEPEGKNQKLEALVP